MVLNRVNTGGDKRQETSLIAAGKKLDPHAYDRAAMDRVGAVYTPIVAAAHEQTGKLPHWGSGTYGNHLADVLRSFQIDAEYKTSSVKNAMRRVTASKPLIVLVQWAAGGGHWVVVVSRRTRGLGRASDYTILDPGGHTVVNRGSSTYTAQNGSTGKFANYFVAVKGRIPMPAGRKLPGM